MASKKVLLTIPEQVFQQLKKEKEKFEYFSVQEVIINALRDRYFKFFIEKEKRGRPEKLDEMKILTAKRIFSKN